MEGLAAYASSDDDDGASGGGGGSSSSSTSDDDNRDDCTAVRTGQGPSKRARISSKLNAHELRRSAVSVAFHVRDDPSQHDGRTRQFHHEPGKWPTFVFVPVISQEGLERWVSAIIQCAEAHCARHCTEAATPTQWRRAAHTGSSKSAHNGGSSGYPHISLSRTFPLSFSDIAPFRERIEDGIDAYIRSAAGESCFAMVLQRLKLFTNEDRTRSFISLCAAETDSGKDKQARLVRLIHSVVDPACILVDAPSFYRPAEPHLSVVWTRGDVTGTVSIAQLQTEVESYLCQLTSSTHNEARQLVDGVVVPIDEIRTTSGNMRKSFSLASSCK